MKLIKFVLPLLFVIALASNNFAQRLTLEDWQRSMDSINTVKNNVLAEVDKLKGDVENLKKNLNAIQSYDDCLDDLYKMLGATKADVDRYRKMVDELDAKIRNCEPPKATRQADLDALKKNKISSLPEFYDRVHNRMQAALNNCKDPEPKSSLYTVVPGDCLWCIAARDRFYGNGFAWQAIYNANKDKIRDPNLIFPKQEFSIPNLSSEEKAKYDRLKGTYKAAPTN